MDTGIGFRFHPSDSELVNHYLRQKMLGNDNLVWQIPEINVLSYEPWQLPQRSIKLGNSDDQVWYFFCAPNYKYSNSRRLDRTTKSGYWKVTGKDRNIQDIAIKKTLVFYQGRPKGVRTNWVMHEYTPTFNFPTKRDLVMCKIKKRDGDNEDDVPNYEERESITATAARPEYQNWNYSNYNSALEDSEVQAHMQSFNGYDERDYSLNSAFQWHNNYCNY